MEGNLSEGGKEQAVLEFMDIVGETAERARQYLQATAWGLGDAVQLYFAEGNDVGGANTPVSTAGVPQPGPSEKAPSPAPPLCSGSASAADRDDEETYVRPPLPIKREALYEDFLQTRAHQILQSPSQPSFVDPFRNFEEEANQQLGEPSSHTAPATGSGTRDSLAALYRPPFVFMFQGTFEQAKMEAARQEKWLLVNVQSTKEFASYMLNRDTWAHEAVKDTVGTSFIFWQVYDDTEEGRKVCTYYKLLSMPTILVIDPITGQKMRAWEGMVSAERLLEDLVRYMDMGPLEKQPNVFPPQKRPREAAKDYSPPRDAGVKGADQQRLGVEAPAKDGMGVSDAPHSPTPMEESGSFSSGQAGSDTTAAEVVKPDVYPTLPEEPDTKTPGACRVGIRFPDGSRGHRRFLKTDPIKMFYEEWVEGMANMLAHQPSVKHFKLEGWSLDSVQTADSIANALSINERIETLTLDHCKVSWTPLAILLGPLIPDDTRIQSKLQGLFLLNFRIKNTSIGQAIGYMLKKNTTLYEFGVSNNFNVSQYGNTFLREILEALKENQHLKRVKFQGDVFDGKDILLRVLNLIEKNPSLEVDLEGTGVYKGENGRFVQALARRNKLYMAVLNDSFQTITPTSARVFLCGFPHAGTHLQPTILNDLTCSKGSTIYGMFFHKLL